MVEILVNGRVNNNLRYADDKDLLPTVVQTDSEKSGLQLKLNYNFCLILELKSWSWLWLDRLKPSKKANIF